MKLKQSASRSWLKSRCPSCAIVQRSTRLRKLALRWLLRFPFAFRPLIQGLWQRTGSNLSCDTWRRLFAMSCSHELLSRAPFCAHLRRSFKLFQTVSSSHLFQAGTVCSAVPLKCALNVSLRTITDNSSEQQRYLRRNARRAVKTMPKTRKMFFSLFKFWKKAGLNVEYLSFKWVIRVQRHFHASFARAVSTGSRIAEGIASGRCITFAH